MFQKCYQASKRLKEKAKEAHEKSCINNEIMNHFFTISIPILDLFLIQF